jgi:hypothetical protein
MISVRFWDKSLGDITTGRIMKYQVMSYHDISVKYHKPDMAMIGNIKNHIHISI